MSEGFPEARHGRRGKGTTRDTAHHHRKALSARVVALGGEGLAQGAAREVGLIPSAVDGVIPVGGPPTTGKHPGKKHGNPQ